MSGVRWSDFAAAEPQMAEQGRALIYRRGDGEGLFVTVAGDGLPRVHPINVGVVDGRLVAFIQDKSAKARDLEADGRYALHAVYDPTQPHEFLVRGRALRITDPAIRADHGHGLVLHRLGRLSAVRADGRARGAGRAGDRRRLAAAVSILARRMRP